MYSTEDDDAFFLDPYALCKSALISFIRSSSQHLLSTCWAQELRANRPDKVPVLEELNFLGVEIDHEEKNPKSIKKTYFNSDTCWKEMKQGDRESTVRAVLSRLIWEGLSEG